MPVRARRVLGDHPPSPHPAAGSEATAPQLQPGGGSRPKAGRLAAREAGLERGPQRGAPHLPQESENGAELSMSHLSDQNSVRRGVLRPISPTATERVTRVAAQS